MEIKSETTSGDANWLQEQLLNCLDELEADPITIVIAMNNITNDILRSFKKLEARDRQ